MFNELPKLLDRNFAIAYFLPATSCGLALWGILQVFGYGEAAEAWFKKDALIGAAFALVLIWLLALLALALNFPVLRLHEGYGRYHPLRWRRTCYRDRFRREVAPALEIQADIDAARARGENPKVPPEHPERLRYAVENYPDDIEWVLPTRLGNLLRAFEVYPRVVYGIDSIPAWPRLQAVIPEHARTMIADAKAQLDFCINLSLGSWLAGLCYIVLAAANQQLPAPWIPVVAVVVGWAGYRLALAAAMGFGTHVNSAFDLYRSELAKQLNLDLPRSADAERELWERVSRMMIYRSAFRARDLTRFRPRAGG
jgi:hypothetical protein